MTAAVHGPARTDSAHALDLAAAAARAHGIRRVSAVAWRDLDHDDAGGSEVHLDALLDQWAGVGLDVTLHTASVPGRPAATNRHGYRVLRRGGGITGLVRSPWSARRHQPDAVVEAWHGINFCGPLWARGPRLAIVHHVHAPEFHLVLPRPAAWAARVHEGTVSPRLYRSTPVVALSPSVRDDLVGLGYAPGTITVVPPGVAPHFSPGGRRSPHPTILTVGRLSRVKHVERVVHLAARLTGAHPGLELVVVGEGPCRAELAAVASRVGARVRFTGRVPTAELVDLYRSAWLLVSSSEGEGWGMTVTEAAACGTPAVVSDNAGHRHAVVDGATGLVRRTGGEQEAAVAWLLADADSRAVLGRAAQERAAALTWHASAAAMLDALVADARFRATGRTR